MKERHWTSLVTSLRHGQCLLMLGQEGSATPAEANRAGSRNDESFAEALMRQLADELEEDGRRVIGDSLAAVAQQYEDAAGFGTKRVASSGGEILQLWCPGALCAASRACLAAVRSGRHDLSRRSHVTRPQGGGQIASCLPLSYARRQAR